MMKETKIAFLTVILEPAIRFNLEGGCLVARLEILNLVFIDTFFDFSASNTIYKVIIFVKEAG